MMSIKQLWTDIKNLTAGHGRLNPEDNMVLRAAFNWDADYIVTGDRHFLKLKRFMNI